MWFCSYALFLLDLVIIAIYFTWFWCVDWSKDQHAWYFLIFIIVYFDSNILIVNTSSSVAYAAGTVYPEHRQRMVLPAEANIPNVTVWSRSPRSVCSVCFDSKNWCKAQARRYQVCICLRLLQNQAGTLRYAPTTMQSYSIIHSNV